MTIPLRAGVTTAALAVALCLAALAPTGAIAVQSSPPRLHSIALEPATFSLLPGGTQAVRAIGTYTDGSTRDLTGVVVFRTRDSKVATVDAGGLVTALAAGRTEIAATEPQSRVSARTNAKITVPKLKALTVVPEKIALRAGAEAPVQVLGTFENGTTGVDLTARIQLSSNKSSVASVVMLADGVPGVRGVAAGTTNVIARDPASGVKSSNSTGIVTVVNRLLAVTVSPARKTVRVGERSRLKATGSFEKGFKTDISTSVDWSTGDPGIAEVDAEGRVRGLAVGTTTARAQDRTSGITSTASAADATVTVVGDVTGLRVTPTNVVLSLGGKTNLKASASFEGQAELVNFTSKVEWSSADPARVAVDRLGAATCLAAGTVVVSARDAATGITSTATLGDARVLCGIPLLGVKVVPDKISLGPGKTKKVKAYLLYEDGTEIEVTKQVEWTSTDRKIASVDVAEPNIGRVTGLEDGVVSVVARDPATGRSSADPGGTSCTVTVLGQPISIQIEPDPTKKGIINGVLGETLKLKVLAKYVGGATQGIDAFVTWSSSAPHIVQVSNGNDGDRPGFARFLQRGRSTVTITYPKSDTPLPPGANVLTDTVTVIVE